jgi:hypothetical protein
MKKSTDNIPLKEVRKNQYAFILNNGKVFYVKIYRELVAVQILTHTMSYYLLNKSLKDKDDMELLKVLFKLNNNPIAHVPKETDETYFFSMLPDFISDLYVKTNAITLIEAAKTSKIYLNITHSTWLKFVNHMNLTYCYHDIKNDQ